MAGHGKVITTQAQIEALRDSRASLDAVRITRDGQAVLECQRKGTTPWAPLVERIDILPDGTIETADGGES